MKDYEDVYRAFFDESFEALASYIEQRRNWNEWTSNGDWEIRHEMYLFDPVDRGSLYYTYDRMVQSTQRLMSGHLEGLLRSMFDVDGREYSTEGALRYPHGSPWREAPLVVNADGRRVGLLFDDNRWGTQRVPNVDSFDELLIVVTSRTRNAANYSGINQGIRRISLEELFENLFPGEYESFLNHVDTFNARVMERIAFSLLERPTEERMPEVRAECLKRLRSDVESMRNDLATGVYLRDWEGSPVLTGLSLSNQVDRLYKRFLDDGVCEVMIGTCDFADSYVSSEWLYQVNELTRTLEQTGTAVGYVKSVEQLLYDVAALFMEDQVYAMNWCDKDGVSRKSPWDKAFRNPDKLPLWSLIDFFSEETNLGVLSLEPPFDTALQLVLDSFRAEDRNKYVHKANLIGVDGLTKLFEVRRKVELIYLLVLGGCNIHDSSLSELGLRGKPTEVDGREIVSKWAHRIIGLQAFKRDAALADGIEVVLSIDSSVRGAPRAFGQKEGEFWQFRISLRDRGVRLKSSVLDQAYELPLTWHKRDEWESLSAWLKSTFDEALTEAGIIGRAGAPLDVSVSYTHADSGGTYEYLVHGPTGTIIVNKELVEPPTQCKGE